MYVSEHQVGKLLEFVNISSELQTRNVYWPLSLRRIKVNSALTEMAVNSWPLLSTTTPHHHSNQGLSKWVPPAMKAPPSVPPALPSETEVPLV